MLAVHWTPVKNTGRILKNGIRKSSRGVFCFPLTGLPSLDRWWIYFFNQCGVRQKQRYNGIVFRLQQEDLPAYFGHWAGTDTKSALKITDLNDIGKQFREVVLWRLGEQLAAGRWFDEPEKWDEQFLSLAADEMKNHPKVLMDKMKSVDFMTFAFEDYQLVLSNSIPASRIIKVLPQGNEFGRILRRKKLDNKKGDQ